MLKGQERLEAFGQGDVAAFLTAEVALDKVRYQSHQSPRAILLAGQPGAGKTELSTMMLSILQGDAAFINGDDYRRYHPNYRNLYAAFGSDSVQMTSKFSAAVTEGLITQLSDLNLNLVIEGTGRTVEVPRSTAELLTKKGYRVEMAVIATRPEVSLISTLLRFYQMNEGGTVPRATAMEAHDQVVALLPTNLDVLYTLPCITRLRIWNRNLDQCFDSVTSHLRPSDVLKQYWSSCWSQSELCSARALITQLRAKEHCNNLGQGAIIDEIERRVASVRIDG